MSSSLSLTTTVQSGGRIEITDVHLTAGEQVNVVVYFPSVKPSAPHSILEVLANAPGKIMFNTADEVDEYLRGERDAWER